MPNELFWDSKMSTKDFKLHQLLINEWQQKSNPIEASKNIRLKVGDNSITSTKIRQWFKRFDEGDFSIFDKKSPFKVNIRNNPNDPLDSILHLSYEAGFYGYNFKCDGRFITYFRNNEKSEYFLGKYDFFLGIKKEIKTPFAVSDFELFDDSKILIYDDNANSLHLIKPNYDDLTFTQLDSFFYGGNDEDVYYFKITVDELDSSKFLLYNKEEQFVLGQIRDNKIVLGNIREFPTDYYIFGRRLVGNNVQGIVALDAHLNVFCDLDLNTMERNKTYGTFDLTKELSTEGNFAFPFCWSNNRFYGVYGNQEAWQLVTFNLETYKWTNLEIKFSHPRDVSVDSTDLLTLQVGNGYGPNAFYRLPLRKPDTLKNLAWLSASRQSHLFGNDKYIKMAHQLKIEL